MSRDKDQAIGLVASTMLVAASMIGVGVFTTSGFALAALGSPSLVLVAWVIGTVIAVCGAISYSALIKQFPQSGGEYLFLARSVHPAMGFVAGAVSMLAGFTGPIAAAALGLEEYATPMLLGTENHLPPSLIAILAIAGGALLNTARLRWAAQAQTILTLSMLAMLVGFLVCAAFAFATRIPPPSFDSGVTTAEFRWVTMASQLVWISFSFAGFNAAIYLASEVRDAKRTVPRAMIYGTILVGGLYIALNAVFVWAAPFEEITAKENIAQVAATATRSLMGEKMEWMIRAVIVLALATSITAMIMAGPRVYAKMAADGCLPRFLATDGKPSGVAIWMQAGTAMIVVGYAELKMLLSYLGLTLSLCSALAISMLFVLRLRGEIDRLPLWGIPPALFVVATVVFAILASWGQPIPAVAAIATFALGAVMGWAYER